MGQKIAVIGTGYVGLTTGACLSHLGHEVICADVIPEKVDALNRGEIPILEAGLEELVNEGRQSGQLRFVLGATTAAAEAEFIYLCVPTPQGADGSADLSYIRDAAAEIGPVVRPESIVINKSTVPVGSTRVVEQALGRSDVHVVSNPEFLREGSAVHDFLHPDRIVIGADDQSAAIRVAGLYLGLAAPLQVTDPASAETIKYASNAFLATKISFINEIANVCEATGADVTVVAKGMGMDRRIGPHFLQAGIGYGGSCFPKDVSALKQLAGNSGYHFQLLNAVIEVNELQKRRVIGKLKRHLGEELRGRRIALLGLAFKPNTDDIRQASSIILASRLLAEGAHVAGFDPVATPGMRTLLPAVTYATSAMEALEGADACVLVTEWSEFLELDWASVKKAMAQPIVIDGRNALDGPALAQLGFSYEGIGTRSVRYPLRQLTTPQMM